MVITVAIQLINNMCQGIEFSFCILKNKTSMSVPGAGSLLSSQWVSEDICPAERRLKRRGGD